jgi:GMP reductase
MRIEEDIKLDFKDVLIRPKRSSLESRQQVDLKRVYKFRHSKYEYHGIPIMASNMDGVGTLSMAEALAKHDLFTCLIKWYNTDIEHFSNFRLNNNHYAVSTGTSDEDFKNLNTTLTGLGNQFICIDVANGYNEYLSDFVKRVRNRWPDKTIIAGNVVTADMTQELILRGADIVKVGIGPGSVCTTRIQTGVGYPQLSAIIECADAAHGLGGHIIADGGCTCPGDVAKAFGAGADFVMLGGMLAGHSEGGGQLVNKDTDNPKVIFYGMSSDTAMNKYFGSMAEYRSSEGRTVEIPYKGSVNKTIKNILGGLRSTLTYVGAQNLKNLSKCTTFIKVNRQFNEIYTNHE